MISLYSDHPLDDKLAKARQNLLQSFDSLRVEDVFYDIYADSSFFYFNQPFLAKIDIKYSFLTEDRKIKWITGNSEEIDKKIKNFSGNKGQVRHKFDSLSKNINEYHDVFKRYAISEIKVNAPFFSEPLKAWGFFSLSPIFILIGFLYIQFYIYHMKKRLVYFTSLADEKSIRRDEIEQMLPPVSIIMAEYGNIIEKIFFFIIIYMFPLFVLFEISTKIGNGLF